MRMRQFCYILPILLLLVHHQHYSQHGDDQGEKVEKLRDLFTRGRIHGHIRNYFMSTLNDGDLNDYYANAIGGAMRYESPEFRGFHFGAAGIFTYKAFSNDLNAPDPVTGEFAKWEHELFDVLDFDNFNDLDRLEELYLQYRFDKGDVTYGKLEVEDTPLLNRMDGRMKPFAFKGLWLNFHLNASSSFQISWLDRISPRSTVEWFDFNEGIGLFDNGYQPDGTFAEYHDHLESEGIAIFGYRSQVGPLKLNLYHWYLHHINHTSWLGLEYNRKNWLLGAQYVLQFPDGYQERLEYNQRYIQPEENGQVLSGRILLTPGNWSFQAAYTHAFSSGRFLFPRELGRDQFYTSMNRSRLEGFGDTDIMTLALDYRMTEVHLTAGIAFSELWGPETNAYIFNKYDLDAYRQFNAHLEYRFKGFLEGTHLNLLYVYKQNKQDETPEAIFNRSNYHQFNMVMNFDF